MRVSRANPAYEKILGREEWEFICPGCHQRHAFVTAYDPAKSDRTEPRWTFNGDTEKPTFTPSFRTWTEGYRDADFEIHASQCHFFLTDGKLIFLDDCTHDMKGQTVE